MEYEGDDTLLQEYGLQHNLFTTAIITTWIQQLVYLAIMIFWKRYAQLMIFILMMMVVGGGVKHMCTAIETPSSARSRAGGAI